MNWEILYRYVQGTCSEEELRMLGDWLQESPANEDFFITFIEEWGDAEASVLETDAQLVWAEFRRRHLLSYADATPTYIGSENATDSALEGSLVSVRQKQRRGIVYWSYSAAALLLLIITSIFVTRQYNRAGSNSESVKTPAFQEISTVRGQRTNLKLSDGTKVILNASSRLKIPKDYGKQTRTLYLEGEAFFEVIHDEDNPFIVITHDTYTRDLGTQFNVTAYDSAHVEVAVKEGLVSLGRMEKGSPQKEIVELTPNKLGILEDISGLTVSDIEHMDQYVGWAEGKLVFRSTPFPEVVKRLERWFDIDCRIENSTPDLNKRTLTATYSNMSMNEVLRVLSISMDISYTRQGQIITFDGEKKLLNKNGWNIN